jgi:hypothetical protein
MAAVTSAVVGTAVAVSSARKQRKAQESAARDQEQAARASAQLLERAGRQGEADIARQAAVAAKTSADAIAAGIEPIEMFADPESVLAAQEQIISNLPVSGAFADSIRSASEDFIRSRPEFNLTEPVGRELERQADLSVSAATPQFTQSLTSAAQQGLAGITDVSQIKQRGLERIGDIAGSQAAQRATALIGQAPQLAQLASGAQEARLLGDVAGQQARASQLESVARLGGQLFDPKAGLLRDATQKNPFGKSGFEGTGGI